MIAAAEEPFQPSWESLSKNALPEWVKDAKFGVYTHWGVYSVPAHGGPDYIRNLYEGSRTDAKGVFSYHTSKYGPPEKFGYKDFIPMFTAPNFDADLVRRLANVDAERPSARIFHTGGDRPLLQSRGVDRPKRDSLQQAWRRI